MLRRVRGVLEHRIPLRITFSPILCCVHGMLANKECDMMLLWNLWAGSMLLDLVANRMKQQAQHLYASRR